MQDTTTYRLLRDFATGPLPMGHATGNHLQQEAAPVSCLGVANFRKKHLRRLATVKAPKSTMIACEGAFMAQINSNLAQPRRA